MGNRCRKGNATLDKVGNSELASQLKFQLTVLQKRTEMLVAYHGEGDVHDGQCH